MIKFLQPRTWLLALLIPCLLFVAMCLSAKTVITPLPLKHRSPSEVLPVIQPFLDEGATVVSHEQTILLKTSEENLAEIKQLLSALDQPVLRMRVRMKVFQGPPETAGQHKRVYRTEGKEAAFDQQQVVVADGERGKIVMGKAWPVASELANNGDAQTIRYHYMPSGFSVEPVLRGDQVDLTIKGMRQNLAREGGDKIDFQEYDTKLTVPLGEWVPMSGRDSDEPRGSTVYRTQDGRSAHGTIYIRVDLAP